MKHTKFDNSKHDITQRFKIKNHKLMVNIKKHVKNMPQNNTVIKRTYAAIIMFVILHFVLRNKFYIRVFVFVLKSLALNEVITIREENLKKKHRFKCLLWYFITVSDLFFLKPLLKPWFSFLCSMDFPITHSFTCFALYILGLVIFVVSLRRDVLKKQFLQFSITHFGILMINFPAHCMFQNINTGRFWFIFPVALVATNDIFAYIIGKLFGRNKLTRLSPKKTVEGWIGGFIFTVITGMVFIYLILHFNVYKDSFDATILEKSVSRFKVPVLYLHGISFILFASFIAPFGGLMASALKRVFKMKDFATYLPGHGGITDRIDCQLLMGIFTRYYISAFIIERKMPIDKLVNTILSDYNKNEVQEIVIKIAKHFL